jgi:DNA-binding transcriptional MerR regulator/effector-binding domain-containing protein
MFTIGEFSRITGLTVKTLRFYHENGLLVPAAVDPATGYRSYDAHNVQRAHVIVALRDLDFSLDDIATILADCAEDEDLVDFLEQQRTSLRSRLSQLTSTVRQIDKLIHQQRRRREEQEMSQTQFEIEEREIEPMLVAGIRMKGKYSDCGRGFATLGKRVGRHIAGKPLCLYYDGEYREDDADFEPCFPIRRAVEIAGIEIRQLPACRCVALVHRGPYDELGRSYERALRTAKERGYNITLPTREVYLKGPGMIFRGNPEKYLTEIQLPVERP